MHALWDQLSVSEPTWVDPRDAALFATYQDQQRLVQFLMALTNDFEPVRASLLHRKPLPTLQQAISELISEETRLGTVKSQHSESVLATVQHRRSFGPSNPQGRGFGNSSTQGPPACRYCQNNNKPHDHALIRCPVRVCRFCHKVGPGHFEHACP